MKTKPALRLLWSAVFFCTWLALNAAPVQAADDDDDGLPPGPQSEGPIRAVLVVPANHPSAPGVRAGVAMGAEEAERAASLMQRDFELVEVVVDDPAEAAEALKQADPSGEAIVIGGISDELIAAVAEASPETFIEIRSRRELAPEDSTPDHLVITPTYDKYVAALFGGLQEIGIKTFAVARDAPQLQLVAEQKGLDLAPPDEADVLLAANPTAAPQHEGQLIAGVTLPAGPGRAVPSAWHHSLRKYGAGELNERFLDHARREMDEDAYHGWLAIKLITEAALNDRYVTDVRTDGHKGDVLHFRYNQLQQPLYVAINSGSHAEVVEGLFFFSLMGISAEPKAAAKPTQDVRPTENHHIWVSNEWSGTVSVFESGTNRLLATIPVGSRPRGIQATQDGRYVYVALSDDEQLEQGSGDAIAAIDAKTREIVSRYDAGSDPEQFALSSDGTRLYAANEDAGTASITDLENDEVLATLVVGIEPEGVGISPDDRWVYITAETSNTVSVIDTDKKQVVSNFLVDPRPRATTFSPTDPLAFVTAEIGGTLSIVDTESHQIVSTVDLQNSHPVGVVVAHDGSEVYVANGHGNSVSVVDPETAEVVAMIPVGERPWGVALSPDGRRLYSANGITNNISVIDLDRREVVATVEAGERPWGIAITPATADPPGASESSTQVSAAQ